MFEKLYYKIKALYNDKIRLPIYRSFIGKLWAKRSTISWLEYNCIDWDLICFDWPPAKLDPYWNGKTHYICYACWFFCGARAIGRTPREAANRAVKVLHIRIKKMPTANHHDLQSIQFD